MKCWELDKTGDTTLFSALPELALKCFSHKHPLNFVKSSTSGHVLLHSCVPLSSISSSTSIFIVPLLPSPPLLPTQPLPYTLVVPLSQSNLGCRFSTNVLCSCSHSQCAVFVFAFTMSCICNVLHSCLHSQCLVFAFVFPMSCVYVHVGDNTNTCRTLLK
jgi:hypothetical protein